MVVDRIILENHRSTTPIEEVHHLHVVGETQSVGKDYRYHSKVDDHGDNCPEDGVDRRLARADEVDGFRARPSKLFQDAPCLVDRQFSR